MTMLLSKICSSLKKGLAIKNEKLRFDDWGRLFRLIENIYFLLILVLCGPFKGNPNP